VWLIEPKGPVTRFTAKTYLRAGYILKKVFRKGMAKLIAEHDRHVGEEGENLKKILENKLTE
jgi:hypothetical protein